MSEWKELEARSPNWSKRFQRSLFTKVLYVLKLLLIMALTMSIYRQITNKTHLQEVPTVSTLKNINFDMLELEAGEGERSGNEEEEVMV